MNNTISYLAGGMLGDFIYELSIIKEKYIETGKKGNLYLSEKGESFRFGLENTFNDTYQLIINQEYIECYEIYKNQQIDIDLNSWRWNKSVDYKNWYIKYSETYNVEWGKNKWLVVSTDEKWSNKVLINTTDYRWPIHIDFHLLDNLYKNDLVFISFDETQYKIFKEKTGLNIDLYKPKNLIDLCVAINSCKLFVGSQSTPLTIAMALHKQSIIGQCVEEFSQEHGHHYIQGLNNNFSNIRYHV